MSGKELEKRSDDLEGRKIALVVTGSVAGIKSPLIARELRRHGAKVFPWMTEAAEKFSVSPDALYWATGNEVIKQLSGEAEHLRDYDLVLVAPATLNTMGKVSNGVADNPVTSLCASLPFDKQVYAPAMHSHLWENESLQRNLEHLKDKGATIVPPVSAEGAAKLPTETTIVDWLIRSDYKINGGGEKQEGDSRQLLILAGPTRYNLDPVRYLSSTSTGILGSNLAREGFRRDREVTVVYGPGEATIPSYISVLDVKTPQEMLKAALQEAENDEYDEILFAAAVLDYRPSEKSDSKRKSGGAWNVQLKPTEKVIERISATAKGSFRVGFKLESQVDEDTLIGEAKALKEELNLDMVVANELSQVNRNHHPARIIDEVGTHHVEGDKRNLASSIFDRIEARSHRS